jgi:hypothetical protein
MEMPNNPEQTTKVFSMRVDDLYDFLNESKSLLSNGKQMVFHHLDNSSDYVVGNLGEMCSLSAKICLHIQTILDVTDDEDDVVYVHAKDMLVLQTLLLNKYYLTEELGDVGISLVCH